MGTHGREGEAIAVVADGDCIAFTDSTGDDVAAQGRFDGIGSLTLAIKENRCEASKMAYFFVKFFIFFLSNV